MTTDYVPVLDPQEIHKAVTHCLFKPEELPEPNTPPEGAVIVEGLVRTFGFHPERLESKRELVKGWLSLLPHQFMKDQGGGWSFMNACVQENGQQWGEHQDMEALFVLGIGLGLVEFQLPREMWSALPGGVPYLVIDLN